MRATIGLHSRPKNLCTTFTCLLMTLRKGRYRKLLECCFAHKGLRLDLLRASDQCFLGEPLITLGDSIELFAIVTSPNPFSLKNLTSCSKLSTEEFVRKRRVSSPLIVLCIIHGWSESPGNVAVNVKLLAQCGKLDTKLSAVLVKHTFF